MNHRRPPDLAPPPYRVEYRADDGRADLILGFFDALPLARVALATHRVLLRARGERGEVVLVEQATETIVRAVPVGPG